MEESDRDVSCKPILFNLYGEYLKKEALAEVVDFKIEGRLVNKERRGRHAIIAITLVELQDMMHTVVDTGRRYGIEINIDIT